MANGGENGEFAHLVTDTLQTVEGIARTQTLLAFKAYSRHDLEGIFSAGME